MVNILITGTAGFVGSSLAMELLRRGYKIIGIDNINDYYDPSLKEARLKRFATHPNYVHCKFNIADRDQINSCFQQYRPRRVVNLAAQAGVRYSMLNPMAYIESNVMGFANILEGCRNYDVEHLVYASTASVYGANTKMPFSLDQPTNHPLSLYAATKKSNELMAHSYSNLYDLPTTGLRFFNIYGPWGRPDMALYKFTRAILNNEKITVYNYGNHRRDFTYIDDIVEGVIRVLESTASKNTFWNGNKPDAATSSVPWRIYNIGNSSPVNLLDYISELEKNLVLKARVDYLPLQPGDVPDTFADISDFIRDFKFKPSTSIEHGVNKFVEWYKKYHNL